MQKVTTWLDEAMDGFLRLLVPANVESTEVRKELHLAVGEVVVNPIGQSTPVGPVFVTSCEPRKNDTGGRTFLSFAVEAVPNVPCVVRLVFSATVAVLVAKFIDVAGPE